MCRVELCSFSGYKIYPGHGRRYARIDGKVKAQTTRIWFYSVLIDELLLALCDVNMYVCPTVFSLVIQTSNVTVRLASLSASQS